MEAKKIIWTLTRICPWNCSFCCIDAYYVHKEHKHLAIASQSLKYKKYYQRDYSRNRYDDANEKLQKLGLELNSEDKLKILKHLDVDLPIDFSGGDPLVVKENLEIIKAAARKFGKERISITTTGIGLSLIDVRSLNPFMTSIDFTYDNPGTDDIPYRQKNYNKINLWKIRQCVMLGIRVTAQIPISKFNSSEHILKEMYNNLREAGVNRILIMKLLPVGRGAQAKVELLSSNEYNSVIKYCKELESIYNGPEVYIHSIISRRHEEKDFVVASELFSTSLNISNKGLLLASPWAYNKHGNPIPQFIIGDLKKHKLSELADEYEVRMRYNTQHWHNENVANFT